MKKVVTYANCQANNVIHILAKHPVLSKEYDFENPVILSNFALIQENKGIPYHEIESADLFIYQPTADKHGVYATSNILQHCKPTCKRISFPYIYNYSFWEVLVFADGDYTVGHSATKYAYLNHRPITKLKEQGVSFEEITRRILSKTFDWEFESRYRETQEVLRLKESECDVKVSEFIDKHHKNLLLFYTQNHVGAPLIKHVADQVVSLLGEDPTGFPSNLPLPDYAPTGGGSEIPIGWFAWKHFGFTFMEEPSINTLRFVLSHAKQIYDGKYANV
jgi:hypothetical protein